MSVRNNTFVEWHKEVNNKHRRLQNACKESFEVFEREVLAADMGWF